MTYYQFFGVAAPIISLIAFVPYLKSIFKGETKPSAASWWTWAILALVATTSAWVGGAPWPVLLLPGWLFVSQLGVAILSIKYGDNHWDKKNKVYVGGAILSILIWIVTGNPLIALGLTILSDLFASMPNFRHVARNPEQEDKLAWSLGWFSGLFVILAIQHWSFVESAWAIYFILNYTVIMYFIYRKRG